MEKLPKSAANYAPLTPITFLHRAASAYADRTSIIYGDIRFSWKQTHDRCLRLAAALRSAFNISKGDVVSVIAPNVPALYEMHFAVPMSGGVLNAINTRLDAHTIATILGHAESRLLFVDPQYLNVARDALLLLASEQGDRARLPVLILIEDEAADGVHVHGGVPKYEEVIAMGDPLLPPVELEDEWDPITLNYTSGTTSAPKGVVYSHRGAYLSTLTLLLQWEVNSQPVYLWSLPMFHCNGWTFTWGIAARGGANVCIRAPTAEAIYSSVADHGVTHMCCAPVIFNILLEAPPSTRREITKRVNVLIGGAPPPAALLERIERMGFHITHAYGLTEATGPALVCEWRGEWDRLPAEEQARLKARQGISVLSLAETDVKNSTTMKSVPRDGKSLGEITLRGSSIMKGYYKNSKATGEAFRNGWFLTGDVGVMHPDGYIEIKDRAKDVIISGGENISSVEVESVLYKHPAVMEAAVVGMLHPRWGETPCGFLTLKIAGTTKAKASEKEIIAYCRANLPHFMVPKKVVIMDELPKGLKVKKFQLREMAKRLALTPAPGPETMTEVVSRL